MSKTKAEVIAITDPDAVAMEEMLAAKRKKVKLQQNKLNKIFRNISADRKTVVDNLIQNVAFMAVELAGLQEEIYERGMVERYQNGENQSGYKPSSAAQVYNATLKSYNTSLKLLLAELDSSSKGDAKSELATFLAK